MFANCNGPAMDFSFPDVCKTPVGPVPVPLPYPNMQMSAVAIPTQFKVFTMCMPAHNLLTMKPISLGDQPGILMGLISQFVMGPIRHLFGSIKVFFGGPPCTKMLSPTGHNGMAPNIPGITLSPSQIKVIVIA